MCGNLQHCLWRSNAIRNDLQHPNEYLRGATLRFIASLGEVELLEPLVPTVRQCLVLFIQRPNLARRTSIRMSGKAR